MESSKSTCDWSAQIVKCHFCYQSTHSRVSRKVEIVSECSLGFNKLLLSDDNNMLILEMNSSSDVSAFGFTGGRD